MNFTREELEKKIVSYNTIHDLAYVIHRDKHLSGSNGMTSEKNYIDNLLEITISKVLELIKDNKINIDYRYDIDIIKNLIKSDEFKTYEKSLPRHSYMRKLCTALERSATFKENEPDLGCKDETVFSLLLKNVYSLDYSDEIISILNSNLSYKISSMGKSFVTNVLNIKEKGYYGSSEFREKLSRCIISSNNISNDFKVKFISKLISLNPSYACNQLAAKVCDGTYLSDELKKEDFSEALHRSIITNQPVLSEMIIDNLSYDPNYYFYEKKDDKNKIVTLLELVLDPSFSNKNLFYKIISNPKFNIDSINSLGAKLYDKVFICALSLNQKELAFGWLKRYPEKFGLSTLNETTEFINTKKCNGIDKCSELVNDITTTFIELSVERNDNELLNEVAEFEAQNDPYLASDLREKRIEYLAKLTSILKETLRTSNIPTVRQIAKRKVLY